MLLLALVSKRRVPRGPSGRGVARDLRGGQREVLWSLLPLPVGAGGREAMGLRGEMVMGESFSLTSSWRECLEEAWTGIAGSARQEWV